MSASMAEGIVEVLLAHWTRSTHTDKKPSVDKCDGCGEVILTWGDGVDANEALAAHQATVLAANGYGKLPETKELNPEQNRMDWYESETDRRLPKRIQRRRTKGWRMPENTMSVCRPGRWGNDFRIGATGWIPVDNSGKWSKEPHEPLTREQAVECFRFSAEFTAREWPGHYEPLRGKNLACWCPLDKPCHADVLLELANE